MRHRANDARQTGSIANRNPLRLPPSVLTTTMIAAPPVQTPTRVFFGIGSASESIHVISFNIFCFFYYVQVLGVPGTLIGIVAAIAIIIDAISDPAVGMLSDRLRTRLGRRHPLMLLAALPLGFCFAALFSPPAGQSDIFLAIWMLVFAAGTRIALTFFSVPHLAFGAELDATRLGRTKTMSWHAAFIWVGGAACHFIGLTFFFDGPRGPDSGLLRADSYPLYGMVWGAVLSVVVLISALFTLHRARHLPTPDAAERATARELLRDFIEVFSNRNYLWLLVGLVLYAATSGMHDAFSSHLAFYYFELAESQYRFYGIAALVGYTLGFAATTYLHKRIGKVALLAITAFGCTVASSASVWLRMLGVLPENGSPMLLPSLLFLAFLFYGQQSMLIISVASLLGDIADEHELLQGRRREGVFYSSRSFFGKATTAIGHMFVGIILDVIDFPLGTNVLPGTIDAEVIYSMGISYGIVATIPGLLAGFAYLQCKLNTARHNEILTLLAKKHRGQTEAVAPPLAAQSTRS